MNLIYFQDSMRKNIWKMKFKNNSIYNTIEIMKNNKNYNKICLRSML